MSVDKPVKLGMSYLKQQVNKPAAKLIDLDKNQQLVMLGLIAIALIYFNITGKFQKLLQLAVTGHTYTNQGIGRDSEGGNGNEGTINKGWHGNGTTN